MTDRIYTRDEVYEALEAEKAARGPDRDARVNEAIDWVFRNHARTFQAFADSDAREDLNAARRALVTFLAYRR